MPTSEVRDMVESGQAPARQAPAPPEEYRLTFFEQPFFLVSLIRQLRERARTPKITVPRQYYQGEVTLPVTEMQPWYRDIFTQIKALREKPRPPAIPITSQPVDVPDIWQDYKMQPASWLNSVLVNVLMISALLLPFIIKEMLYPVKAATKNYDYSNITLTLPITGPDKKMGGGGGGGDRSPTPASKGKIPEFSKTQFTPPMAVLPNPAPKMPMPATLLGPPDLKLPQMALNMPWGDPQGVAGPPSNGPGTGGGIGSGEGGGVGSGKGGGFGPGEGGGFGGGAYSVGGNVTAPVPIYKPEPAYSEEARKAKYQGTVVLWIVVDVQGNVTDARVVRPLGLGLDEKALETVKTWKFKPALRNGTPVPVRVMVEVSFRLF